MKWREKWELATGVDSKALKGSLSHYKEVCEYSEQHLVFTAEECQCWSLAG